MEKFGPGGIRFSLGAMSSSGTDIAFNERRTEGYGAFANKIWNAAGFMFMNVDRIAPGLRPGGTDGDVRPHTGIAGFEAVTLEDRWILSRFNSVTRSVNDSLASYRFDEAANAIYDFFWGEFCDWYIELIKLRLQKIDHLFNRERVVNSLKERHEKVAGLVQQVGEENLGNLRKLEEEESAGWRPTFSIVSDQQIADLEKRARSKNTSDWREATTAWTNQVILFVASHGLRASASPVYN